MPTSREPLGAVVPGCPRLLTARMRLLLRIFGQPVVSDAPRSCCCAACWALRCPGADAGDLAFVDCPRPFPQVPLLGIALNLPAWCDAFGLAGMIGGTGAGDCCARRALGSGWAAAVRRGPRPAWSRSINCGCSPGPISSCSWRWCWRWPSATRRFALLRLLIVSFYLHSAFTKFDYSFLHTLGQQFLGGAGRQQHRPPERRGPGCRGRRFSGRRTAGGGVALLSAHARLGRGGRHPAARTAADDSGSLGARSQAGGAAVERVLHRAGRAAVWPARSGRRNRSRRTQPSLRQMRRRRGPCKD